MKTKTLRKKLSIKKQTVADLNGNEMKKIAGGHTYCFPTTCICGSLITCPEGCSVKLDCIEP